MLKSVSRPLYPSMKKQARERFERFERAQLRYRIAFALAAQDHARKMMNVLQNSKEIGTQTATGRRDLENQKD